MERPTEESRWLAVLERVAERLLWSSLVDLGTGTLGSSRYLLYFLMWLACVVSHLCREHNSSGFRVFLSSKTFGHKSCILVRLFLHRVNSHNYLYHHQNMDPRYPPSKRREPVSKDRIILRASLETAIGQVSGFSLLKDPRDHARDRKQRKLHLAPIFECTFHRLTALASSCFFSQLFCLIQHF